MVPYHPMTTTHDNASRGGRKVHLATLVDNETTWFASLCGVPERSGFLCSVGLPITSIREYVEADGDGDLCGLCARKAVR